MTDSMQKRLFLRDLADVSVFGCHIHHPDRMVDECAHCRDAWSDKVTIQTILIEWCKQERQECVEFFEEILAIAKIENDLDEERSRRLKAKRERQQNEMQEAK